MDLRVLTLINFGENPGEATRVTISPHQITAVLAKDGEIQGRPIKETNVLFIDGGSIGLRLSEMDLLTLEQAVGSYTLEPIGY